MVFPLLENAQETGNKKPASWAGLNITDASEPTTPGNDGNNLYGRMRGNGIHASDHERRGRIRQSCSALL